MEGVKLFNHIYNTTVILVWRKTYIFSKRTYSPSSTSMKTEVRLYIYLLHRTHSTETRCKQGRVMKLLPYIPF